MKTMPQDILGSVFITDPSLMAWQIREILINSGRMGNMSESLILGFVGAIMPKPHEKLFYDYKITQNMVDRAAEQFLKELGEMG